MYDKDISESPFQDQGCYTLMCSVFPPLVQLMYMYYISCIFKGFQTQDRKGGVIHYAKEPLSLQ